MMLTHYKEARKYFEEALLMEEDIWAQGKQHSEDWTRLKERLLMLMDIENKPKAKSKYQKRFKVNISPFCKNITTICFWGNN